ncbi:MAG: hypothetical protein V5786_00845 [Psychromonas sp.]
MSNGNGLTIPKKVKEQAINEPANSSPLACVMVNSIMILAMTNNDVLHINVIYQATCSTLYVNVFNVDGNIYKPIFSRVTHLDVQSTIEDLKDLEDELIELIGNAKDNLDV